MYSFFATAGRVAAIIIIISSSSSISILLLLIINKRVLHKGMRLWSYLYIYITIYLFIYTHFKPRAMHPVRLVLLDSIAPIMRVHCED
jgi:hypothetical protein